jgi:uncharacterized membrane-anchored protein
VDPRTRQLADRLRPGEIAVIDHIDLDRGAAEALVAARPAAVVNVAPSMSGRFPALGAGVVVDAGIPLLDQVGVELFTLVPDGAEVRLHGPTLYVGDHELSSGVLQSPQSVAEATTAARRGLTVQLQAFTACRVGDPQPRACAAARRQRGPGAEDPARRPAGRRGDTRPDRGGRSSRRCAASSRTASPCSSASRPGADVIRAVGLAPQVIVGDFDRVSDAALQSGAELVLHSRHTTRPPGEVRAERLVVATTPFPYAGRSEDAALLLADQGDASVIVLVGGSEGLVAALDAGRTAMASTFLTRLEVSGRLVSANSVAALHRRAAPRRLIGVMLVCQALALGAAVNAAGGPSQAWERTSDSVTSGVTRASDSVTGALDDVLAKVG